MSTSHDANLNYINCEKGIWSWLSTLDHKRIALMYMWAVMAFFFCGGMAAMLIRAHLWNFQNSLFSDSTYNQLMTYHGAIMVFMVIIPGIPAIFGNFFLPLHIGAKDVAFPRLNLMSWYVFMFGAILAVSTLFTNKVDTGWTFYAPYSLKTSTAVVSMVLAAFIMGMSSILTGLNFIVTTHKLRAPGMTMLRIPLFVWAIYSTAILQVLATPVLGITLLLIVAERVLGVGVFDPKLGGDPVLFQHFFWFYSHPAVYIMILPAMGIISEVITTFSRKTVFGYTAIAMSSVGIAAVSFFVWGHHMYVSGQSEIAGIVFSFITMLVGVPTAIKMFNWLATMYGGSIQFRAPMLYAFGFLFVFMIGGVTGIMLATVGLDVHLHDTYFVIAHFHYTMVGGSLMALMAAFFHWLPKMFGKMYNEYLAIVSWLFVFIGFNVTFFPQFIAGANGMNRRYATYLESYQTLNRFSSIGAFMIGTGFIIGLITIMHGIFKGKPAGANPWGSKTLEWTVASPPPHHNFDVEPIVTGGPYEYR